MTNEAFLTRRWNNLLTLGIGLPILVYAYAALSTGFLSDFWAFIGMSVLGAVY